MFYTREKIKRMPGIVTWILRLALPRYPAAEHFPPTVFTRAGILDGKSISTLPYHFNEYGRCLLRRSPFSHNTCCKFREFYFDIMSKNQHQLTLSADD